MIFSFLRICFASQRLINCTSVWFEIYLFYFFFIDTFVDFWESSFDLATFLEKSFVSSSQYSMKRLEFDRFFFKKVSIMFSNLYRLSRSLRFSIAITIWETLSHTISRKTSRYSKSISIKISKTRIDNFSTLKQSQKNQKWKESTYSKSRIVYSFFDENKRKMNDSNFFWNIFQFRSLRIRFFKIVNFLWYFFIASSRILRVDCKFEYVSFIIFLNVCVSTRSKIEMICDCSFSKRVVNRVDARKKIDVFLSISFYEFSTIRESIAKWIDTTKNWTFKLFKVWTIWRKLLIKSVKILALVVRHEEIICRDVEVWLRNIEQALDHELSIDEKSRSSTQLERFKFCFSLSSFLLNLLAK